MALQYIPGMIEARGGKEGSDVSLKIEESPWETLLSEAERDQYVDIFCNFL